MEQDQLNLPICFDTDYQPERAHDHDAGLDLKTTHNAYVKPGRTEKIHTGVFVNIPAGYVGYLHVRSSVGIKRNLSLANGTGVIDAGYTGEIIAALHNHGRDRVEAIAAGDKVVQLVLHKLPKVNLQFYSDPRLLADTTRGCNGFGSTGR